MLAVAPEGGHLPSLLLQPLSDLRLLLSWDLLASSLQPIPQLIQPSVCVLGLQEGLRDTGQSGGAETTSTPAQEDKAQDRETPQQGDGGGGLTASLCRNTSTSVRLSGFSKHSLTDSCRSWNHPSKDCRPSGGDAGHH